jgi:ABC-2 type transport system ATP-binding protein
MMAMAAGIERTRIDAVLELVGLTGDARRRVGEYSTGMRQRLELAGALLGDPGVLILDEPSNGLDPQGIAWLREFLRHLALQGRTVLVSSHLLAEMAQTVDDVVILSDGTVRAQGPLASLTAQVRSSMRVRTPEPDRLGAVVSQAGLVPRRVGPDMVVVDGATPEQLGPVLAANAVVIYELVQETQDLEHLFFGLTTPYGGSPAGWAPPTGPGSPGPLAQGPLGSAPVPGPPAEPPPPPPRWTSS